jgi:transposase InsO family protein
MRFAFIDAHAHTWRITTMCRVLEVSRAGYYAWRARPVCERVKDDQRLTTEIRAIHLAMNQRYGSPRMHQELRARGLDCGKHRAARLMREAGLQAKSAPAFRPATTDSAHEDPVAPNVVNREFALAANPAPDHTWVGDITYIPTREGWLYLAVLLDLATRRVVGWALGSRIDQELPLAALRMALQHRGARGGRHHSDRGAQYTARAYQQELAAAGFTASMSRVGNCWDNAVAESFFATLTKELLVDGVFETRDEASRAVFEFIEIWYNRQRRHSTLGYLTPSEYEETLKAG